jgi:hypothetical protein
MQHIFACPLSSNPNCLLLMPLLLDVKLAMDSCQHGAVLRLPALLELALE